MRRLFVSLMALVLIGCTGIPVSFPADSRSSAGALDREGGVEKPVEPAEPTKAGLLGDQEDDEGVEEQGPDSDAGSLEGEREESGEETNLVLDNLGPAPELENDVWLNTDEPLRLASLRGKVVLLEMWTFG